MRIAQDFKFESLLFVAFFATLPLYSPNLVMFNVLFDMADKFIAPFVDAMMLVVVVAGLGVAWLAARRNACVFARPSIAIGGAVLYVAGFALLLATLGIEEFGSVTLARTAGVAVALGVVSMCVAWGMHLSVLDLRQALFSLALMLGMASVIGLLLPSVDRGVGLVVFGLLLALGVSLPCWKAATGTLWHPEVGVVRDQDPEIVRFAPEASVDAPTRGTLVSSVRRMASILAMPFIGLLVFAYVMGVRKFMVFDVFYVESLGGIVAAAFVLPLCLVKTSRPLLSCIYQIFLPLFALALIVLNSFPVGAGPQWLAATMSYVFYGVVGILALASLCAMAHAREFSPVLIYGLTVASFAAASMLGIFSGTLPLFEYESGGPVLLVLSTAYFAVLVGWPLVVAWRQAGCGADGNGEQSAAQAERDGLQEHCGRVAVAGSLSPRETEILGYLGRGHGIVFVANTLVISESTVRTHVKSIYRKLGVSSREELLRLVDEA